MDFNIEITRSSRKRSVGFSVRWPDTMVVTAPRNLDGKILDKMIGGRRAWALKRLNRLAEEYHHLGLPKYYSGGETFPYLGKDCQLTVLVSGASARPKCYLVDGRFIVEIRQTDDDNQPVLVEKAINNWYRKQADNEIREGVDRWSPVTGKAPVSLSVRNQRSRWGSCSRRGAISLNWRLVLLPPNLLDYVVVHELYHMIEPNHSSRFWKLVEKTMPDYKSRRKELRNYAAYLDTM